MSPLVLTWSHSSSNTLSGNRANPILNSAGKDDKNHSRIFDIESITNHPDIRLTRGGMILVGLMSGGDYQQGGLARCGVTTAHALARCGFGDSLLEASMNLDGDTLQDFLASWREEVRDELRTNSKGEIGRKQMALANSITGKFPDINVLLSYVKPITSESMGRATNNLRITWDKEPDLAKLAGVCEFYFEWGYKEAIVKRFRTIMWHSIVLRILRRAVLDLDQARSKTIIPTTPRKKNACDRTPCGTPSKMIAKHFASLDINSPSKAPDEEDEEQRLIVKVHACRQHPSTDGLSEYRLEIAPKQLVQLTESGIKGLRTPEEPDEWASEEVEDDGDEGKKISIDPESHLRVWMPACMVKLVEPKLVDDFEGLQEKKRLKKEMKGTRQASSKGKAPVKKKNDAEDVFSAQHKKLKSKKSITTTPISSFPFPSPGDETSTESEKLPTQSFRPSQQPTRQPEAECNLRRKGRTNTSLSSSSERLEAASRIHPVDNVSSISVKPRAVIRDLTKKRHILSATMQDRTQVSFRSSSKKQEGSSCTESDLGNHIKKSPRKSLTNKSQRARPVSPSPSKPLSKKFMNVIEISSESDCDEPLREIMHPLLRARARAMTSQLSATKTILEPRIPSDIIDLT